MSDEEIKAAEKRGYARGYAAGKVRRKTDATREHLRKSDQAFLDRAFIAALPACFVAQGWKTGDKPINTLNERVDLAWRCAEQALKSRRYAK